MCSEGTRLSMLRVPRGLWRLKRRPYFSNLGSERSVPWGWKEAIEDTPYSRLLKDAGFDDVQRLGKGSFSTVWRAIWVEHRLPVALKVYDKTDASSRPAIESLSTEVEVLRRSTHPYLVSCFGVWETECRVCLCLELLQGDLLTHLRTHGPASESQAKTWFAQNVSAVSYLHDLHIAHRDIKCENILLDSCLNCKLADFGLAALDIPWDETLPNGSWEKVSDFRGSEAYFSPEILLRLPYSPFLADVWALGVVLYATLFAKLPFDTGAEGMDAREMPTMWRPAPGVSVSKDCVAVLQRLFLLEKRRAKPRELVALDWFDEPPQMMAVELAAKARKTLQELAEGEQPRPPVEDVWGASHLAMARSRHCLDL